MAGGWGRGTGLKSEQFSLSTMSHVLLIAVVTLDIWTSRRMRMSGLSVILNGWVLGSRGCNTAVLVGMIGSMVVVGS